jgi:hypothetical protein
MGMHYFGALRKVGEAALMKVYYLAVIGEKGGRPHSRIRGLGTAWNALSRY